jgi:hypothetical protein
MLTSAGTATIAPGAALARNPDPQNASNQLDTTHHHSREGDDFIIGPISAYSFEGTMLLDGAPAAGDTVMAYDSLIAPTDSLMVITDENGEFRHDSVTAVPDLPSLADYVKMQAVPNPDPRTIQLTVPQSHEKIAQDYALRVLNLRGADVTDERVGAGVYLLELNNQGERIKTGKMLLGDGGKDLSELETTLVATQHFENNARKSRSVVRLPMDVVFKYAAGGYQTETVNATLDPDVVTDLGVTDLEQEAQVGTVTAHGRTGDEIGNLLANGGAWRFVNSSSGDEYLASLDEQGNWEVSLPDTIPSDRQFYVSFTGNADVREGTFTFMKSDESSATGVEFTNVDVHEGQETHGLATLDQLTYDAGHVALTFSQASAANDTILYMIRGYVNEGVVKYVNPLLRPYNRLENYPEGEYVGDERREQHNQSLLFVMSLDKLPGVIQHPYYEGIEPIEEGFGAPSDILNRLQVRERNDVNASGARYPPGQNYMTGGYGQTNFNDNQITLVLELLEARGINDFAPTGSNHHAINVDLEQEIVTGLNSMGKAIFAVANTYLSGDFSVPFQPQALTTEEFSQLRPQDQYDYVGQFLDRDQ